MELIPSATLASKVELLPKTVTRMDEQLQKGNEGLLLELGITGLKNSGFKRHGIYLQISDGVLHGLLEGSKEGELIMKNGNYKDMG